MDLLDLTALELGKKIQAGEVTAPEAAAAALRRIREMEPSIHAYVTVDEEGAMAQAETVQREIEAGRLSGPLAGVPVAIKDNICTEGLRTTCSSKILEHFVPAYTAQAAEQLKKAGAVILGKTNMDEFAMGSTTETSAFGPTRNPWNTDHVPGGSSGGSCARLHPPAQLLLRRHGNQAHLRHGVPVGAYRLRIFPGSDRPHREGRGGLRGHSGGNRGTGREGCHLHGAAGYRFYRRAHERCAGNAYRHSRQLLWRGIGSGGGRGRKGGGAGACGRGCCDAIPAYYVIASAEASSNLSRFDGVKYGFRAADYEGLHDMYKKTRSQGFGPEVKRRIMLGSFVLSSGYYDAYYLKALRTKALIKREFDKAFASYDCILAPAAPSTAPRLGESLQDPLKMYLGDIYTISVNLAGLPGMTVPCGKDSKGLPIGLQLIGDCFKEKHIIRAAYTFERSVRNEQTV